MRTILKRYGWPILIVLLVGGYLTAEAVLLWRVVPDGSVANLEDYLEWRPDEDDFAAANVDGKQYVIAYGPLSGVFPSGPPAYVFDSDGALVDWSKDIGDDSEFIKKWQSQRHGDKVLSRREVEEFARGRGQR